MGRQQMVVKMSKILEDMALNLGGSKGCLTIWGETKLPDCIREELENLKFDKTQER